MAFTFIVELNMGRQTIGRLVAGASALLLLLVPVTAYAQQSSSTNYQVNEVYFGPGGQVNGCSTAYCADQSASGTATGATGNTNGTQAQAGFNTTEREQLEMVVNGGVFDLGILSASTVRATSASFSVRTVISNSGYVVIMAGNSLKNSTGTHTITALSTPTASTVGTEQFGVNLKLNTSPPGIGSDPQQQPDSTFANGKAATGYDTANQFKFVDGDIIAQSPDTATSNYSNGKTLYTMSIVANIANNTDAGQYAARLTLIAVPTF